MYIKSIVLDGFKSYGQRTEISGFDPMFNAITGLNGSGKSNILDSICFVLGISNLSSVRASSLQDLIFKSGQAGINKATVSITFDNSNPLQCPSGYEKSPEITISRQIVLGGKNKYLINGINVTSKKVQDMFCSIQLNVNNPHFLIMQGRITKVLNMKPPEILSMVEEAAGTKMYEVKRQVTQKLIEKKNAKLLEFRTVVIEELSPKLEKLKAEREQYLEFVRLERELEHLMNIFQVFQYYEAKRDLVRVEQALKKGEDKIRNIEDTIKQNKDAIQKLDDEIEESTTNNQSQSSVELQEIEARLKQRVKEEAKVIAAVKSVHDSIASEDKKKKQLERNLTNEEKTLKAKETELNKVKSLFESLKENDKRDTDAFALAEKKYEALCAGMEVNDQGEAETLAEQLMNAKEELSRANTENQQASMQLAFLEKQLKSKEREAGASSTDYDTDQKKLKKMEADVVQLENSMKRLNFSEDRMSELQNMRRTIQQATRSMRDRVDNFEASKPYTSFKYRDPEPNFNKSGVKGVVCKLFKCKDTTYATALETAAGAKLYNVVVDTDVTSKKLLQKGDLQTRTTFIPLNKISARKMDQETVRFAQSLVGKENCQPALSLIQYDPSLQPAMEFIYGNVFICKDINIAKRVTFHDRIRKRCVTLDGDSTDPAGTLSGGAKIKGDPILKIVSDIQKFEAELRQKDDELAQINQEINEMSSSERQYNSIKDRLDMSKHELNLLRQRLLNTTFARQQEEVDSLKSQIAQLTQKVKSCQEIAQQYSGKVKDLEVKMRDSTGYREKRLKEAEAELKKAKKQMDKSKEEWRKREQDYDTLMLEIQELKKSLENTKVELGNIEEHIKKLTEEYNEKSEGSSEIQQAVKDLQEEVKKIKALIAEKNKEVQIKNKKKDQLAAKNTELELEVKKHNHEIKELQTAFKTSKHREKEYHNKISNDNMYLKKGEEMSQAEGVELERKIKVAQENKRKLGRTVNAQAQSMFAAEEKRFADIVKKQKIVIRDKEQLERTINDLDTKKERALKLAFDQVSKDFGSIFATLLPGANAKLVPLQGKSILHGLEIKVSLGNVWKDSLTELSGGQRSLAALSLILAMLLFKPAPLYILDEVDAALDLSHTQNIGNMLRSHFKKSQFIVVSLKDGMFSNANVLFRTKFVDGMSIVQRTENTRKG
ncbi:structural maintenance of chromosomes protein 2 [Anthonomus grandis grandis]|uniref:structural maintenance of chromosomes protein 2 n=1 Tax=Anthonomus grandis grandis TaxID=2921223 RepID=UPI0021669770|nr:structural maintenance of chromosomes protein 2 [Anthonomus grandis grandis]